MEVTLSVIILAALAVIVTSAPTLTDGPAPENSLAADQEKHWEYYREKRSQYPQYVSPCAAAAAAASSPIPAFAPAAYQVNLSPYHPYATPHNYYAPQYRMDFEPEQEMMSFSDMDRMMSEQMQMRYAGYGAPPHMPGSYAPAVSPVGPAYGVFPNAKTGGCSVPLLFSCAPSIVPGHVVQSMPHGYGDSYRGVEPASHHETPSQESHEEAQEHLSAAHDSSHAKVHQ